MSRVSGRAGRWVLRGGEGARSSAGVLRARSFWDRRVLWGWSRARSSGCGCEGRCLALGVAVCCPPRLLGSALLQRNGKHRALPVMSLGGVYV